MKHVKGHAGIEGNEYADLMANQGVTCPELEEPDWEELRRATQERTRALQKAGQNAIETAPVASSSGNDLSSSQGVVLDGAQAELDLDVCSTRAVNHQN